MKKVIIINGPNLNLLGKREEEIYGNKTFEKVFEKLKELAEKNGIELLYFQSNHEGKIIDKIHQCVGKTDFIIINPGALTHYSYSIHDALKSVKIPSIEVHISNIHKRENWRNKSVISPAVMGVISGLGVSGYRIALIYACEYINEKNND